MSSEENKEKTSEVEKKEIKNEEKVEQKSEKKEDLSEKQHQQQPHENNGVSNEQKSTLESSPHHDEEKTKKKIEKKEMSSSSQQEPPFEKKNEETNKIDPWSSSPHVEKYSKKRERSDFSAPQNDDDYPNDRDFKKRKNSTSPKESHEPKETSGNETNEKKKRVGEEQLRNLFGRTDKQFYNNNNNRFRKNDFRRYNNNRMTGGGPLNTGGGPLNTGGATGGTTGGTTGGNYMHSRPPNMRYDNYDYRRRYNRDYDNNWQRGGVGVGGGNKPFYEKRNSYDDRGRFNRDNFQRNQSYQEGTSGNYNDGNGGGGGYYNRGGSGSNYENRSNFRTNEGFYNRNKNYEGGGGRYDGGGYNSGSNYGNHNQGMYTRQNYREPYNGSGGGSGSGSGNYPPRTEVQPPLRKHSPPLPPNWIKYFTDDEKPYYYNPLSKTSQWEKPDIKTETKPTSSNPNISGSGGGDYYKETNFRNKYQNSMELNQTPLDRQRENERDGSQRSNHFRDNKYDSSQRKYDNIQSGNNNLNDNRGGSQTRGTYRP